MTLPGLEFADVARALTCEAFARREMKLRGNRAQCPFHGGENYNLQFFRDGHCYCHVCHKSGDVVQLAAAVWRVSQLDAARMLNDDFNLGLCAGSPTADERQRRQREREAREAAEQAERAAWSNAADDLREAERATAVLTVDDADKVATWAAVARLGTAQDRWNALRAGVKA